MPMSRTSTNPGNENGAVSHRFRPLTTLSWPGICLLAAGTGGSIATETLEHFPTWGTSYVFEVSSPLHISSVDLRSTREHLSNVRATFKFNMTEIAKLFEVTRPTVYNWMSGTEPKSETGKAIARLSRAADSLKNLGVRRIELYVRRPILGDKSLVDMLKLGQPTTEVISTLVALAGKEAAVREDAMARRSGPSVRDFESLDSLATPIIQERG